MARQNIDGTDFIGKDTAPNAGRLKLNENFTELYLSQPPLAEDTHAESAAITSYPSGISIMPVSAVADWNDWAESGTVTTNKTSNGGWQAVQFGEFSTTLFFRGWDGSLPGWEPWWSPLASGTLDAHIVDTSDAHDASAISYAGGTGMSATDVEAAIDELATEKTDDSALTTHLNDTSDAHDASAISYAGGTGMSATDVEAAIDELALSQPPLAEDTHAESTAITSYPSGISIMPVSAAADWDGLATDATVTTERTSFGGLQIIAFADSSFAFRAWDTTTPEWSSWQYPVSISTVVTLLLGYVATSRTITTTAPLTGGGDLSADRTLAVSAASETASGVAEIATQAETNTGTDDARIVTPLKLKTLLSAPVPIPFFYGSTLSVMTGVGRAPITGGVAGTIKEVRAAVNTAPTGAAINLSVKKNGTQFTTLSIAASANAGSSTGLSTAVVAGDYLSVDITQVGSTVAGANLTVMVEVETA
jgi:hypothetical protein